ncbi:hypothetical protein QTO34_005445, partial [Cnephaeus nilssonii]
MDSPKEVGWSQGSRLYASWSRGTPSLAAQCCRTPGLAVRSCGTRALRHARSVKHPPIRMRPLCTQPPGDRLLRREDTCSSGLPAKRFLDAGVGVIDEDYRGNLSVVLFNFSKESL